MWEVIKEIKINEAFCIHTEFWTKNLKADKSLDGNKIWVQTGFIWHRLGHSSGLL
jgi:hypothetical protein